MAATESSTVVFGAKVRDLISELAAAEDTLPTYNDDAVRQVIAESVALSTQMRRITQSDFDVSDTGLSTQLLMYDLARKRNKRCLVAYHAHRADMVEDLRWKHGVLVPTEVRDKLSSGEVDHFNAYSKLLGDHMTRLGVDLMSDLQPPKDSVVQVVALRDCGRLMTTSGAVDVVKGGIHFMQRFDAEPLVRLGWLKELERANS